MPRSISHVCEKRFLVWAIDNTADELYAIRSTVLTKQALQSTVLKLQVTGHKSAGHRSRSKVNKGNGFSQVGRYLPTGRRSEVCSQVQFVRLFVRYVILQASHLRFLCRISQLSFSLPTIMHTWY